MQNGFSLGEVEQSEFEFERESVGVEDGGAGWGLLGWESTWKPLEVDTSVRGSQLKRHICDCYPGIIPVKRPCKSSVSAHLLRGRILNSESHYNCIVCVFLLVCVSLFGVAQRSFAYRYPNFSE